MQGTRIPERTPHASHRSVVAEISAILCGLLAAALLVWLGLLVYDMGVTYGNVTDGGLPSIAGTVGLVAAGFAAGAASLWARNSKKTLLAFTGVLVLGALIFGAVWLII